MDELQGHELANKLINRSKIRSLCKDNGVHITNKAIDALEINVYNMIKDSIDISKECENKTVLERHII